MKFEAWRGPKKTSYIHSFGIGDSSACNNNFNRSSFYRCRRPCWKIRKSKLNAFSIQNVISFSYLLCAVWLRYQKAIVQRLLSNAHDVQYCSILSEKSEAYETVKWREGPRPPLFWVKIEEITGGRKADRASTEQNQPPSPEPWLIREFKKLATTATPKTTSIKKEFIFNLRISGYSFTLFITVKAGYRATESGTPQ